MSEVVAYKDSNNNSSKKFFYSLKNTLIKVKIIKNQDIGKFQHKSTSF